WVSLQLRELWRYRELLYFLAWRDVKLRYKQTVIGALWAIIQPFMTMVVFTIFFGGLAKIPSEGAPYAVWSYAGLFPWMFFSNGLTLSANSLVMNNALIKKIYFPRLLVPVSNVVSGLVDFIIAFVVLIAMILFFKFTPQAPDVSVELTANVIWLPGF